MDRRVRGRGCRGEISELLIGTRPNQFSAKGLAEEWYRDERSKGSI